MARNVYPYLLKWIQRAKKEGLIYKDKAEPIEKVKIIPDEDFGDRYDGMTISHTKMKLDEYTLFHFEKLRDKYGYGIYLSDKLSEEKMRIVLIHELVHLAGIYQHNVSIGGYVYYGGTDELEKYLLDKFGDNF